MSKIDILKHGEFHKKKFKFVCQCGCVFTVETEPNERDYGLRFIPDYAYGFNAYYDCPECGREVEGEEVDPE